MLFGLHCIIKLRAKLRGAPGLWRRKSKPNHIPAMARRIALQKYNELLITTTGSRLDSLIFLCRGT
eukprot:scaffold194991_cov35-Prasinocladus_malaysianus.AAC.1